MRGVCPEGVFVRSSSRPPRGKYHNFQGVKALNKKTKTIVWVVIAVVLVAVIGLLFMEFISPRYTQIKISEFIAKVEAGEINEVSISSYKLEGLFRDANGTKNYYYCFSWNFYASNDAIVAKWLADGVAIDYANPNAGSMWSTVITVLGVCLLYTSRCV